jgi:hypothetical protein
LGPRRFLGIYLAGGVVGNLFMWGKMAYLNDYTSSWCVAAASRPLLRLLVTPWCVPPDSLGASGSVSAVTVMTAMMFPHSRILLFMVVPIPARVFAGLFIAYETYNSYAGNDRIGRLKLMSPSCRAVMDGCACATQRIPRTWAGLCLVYLLVSCCVAECGSLVVYSPYASAQSITLIPFLTTCIQSCHINFVHLFRPHLSTRKQPSHTHANKFKVFDVATFEIVGTTTAMQNRKQHVQSSLRRTRCGVAPTRAVVTLNWRRDDCRIEVGDAGRSGDATWLPGADLFSSWRWPDDAARTGTTTEDRYAVDGRGTAAALGPCKSLPVNCKSSGSCGRKSSSSRSAGGR